MSKFPEEPAEDTTEAIKRNVVQSVLYVYTSYVYCHCFSLQLEVDFTGLNSKLVALIRKWNRFLRLQSNACFIKKPESAST